MTNSTKLDEKLEGAENFRVSKYTIMFILKEHDLDGYIKQEVKEPEGEEVKSKKNKDMIKFKRIISKYIKDHLISQVSSNNTPNEVFDSLPNMFEGKNINRRMTLRNQLKGVNMQKEETMQSYFSRAYT